MTQSLPSRYSTFVLQHPYESPEWEGSVTVCFGHPRNGWIMLWIAGTPYLQSLTIHTSDVFDPYTDLIHWLEAIAQDQLPAQVIIDEEGQEKTLVVVPAGNEQVDFQILNDYIEEKDKEILLRLRVSKRQLIAEFIHKFELFQRDYYQRSEWPNGVDIKELDLSILNKFLQNQ